MTAAEVAGRTVGSERAPSRGFTLIELLVAIAIVAIIGVMAFVGLSRVIKQQALAREHTERWQ